MERFQQQKSDLKTEEVGPLSGFIWKYEGEMFPHKEVLRDRLFLLMGLLN